MDTIANKSNSVKEMKSSECWSWIVYLCLTYVKILAVSFSFSAMLIIVAIICNGSMVDIYIKIQFICELACEYGEMLVMLPKLMMKQYRMLDRMEKFSFI